MKMSLLHDWAESKIGDFMPDEITNEKKTELEHHTSEFKIQQSELLQLEQNQAKIEKSLDQANTILKQTQDLDSLSLEPKASLEKIDAFLNEQQKFKQLKQDMDNFHVDDSNFTDFQSLEHFALYIKEDVLVRD